MTDREWCVALDAKDVDDLHVALSLADQRRRTVQAPDKLVFVVDRYSGLRIEVFAREHPPPHFRVSCQQGAANYLIKDCSQMNGALRNEFRTIRDWHAKNKSKLIDAWNKLRPTDCPVGEYCEA